MMTVAPALPANYNLSDIENLSSTSSYYAAEVSFSNIRERALQEAAQALGMQAALAYESKQIDAILEANAPQLNQIFDFNQVLYQHNVLPPVLDNAHNQVNINNAGDTIRIAGVTYRILTPVRFVTAPPLWRDYIWMSYSTPELPNKVLLPKNDQERAYWQANVALGWQQGINQAVSIFTINLSRLVRDFNGMLLYKELLAQNMVSPYHLNMTKQGITGTGTNMVIDDRTLQITTQPQLQLQGKLWQAAPTGIRAPESTPTAAPESTAPGTLPAIVNTAPANQSAQDSTSNNANSAIDSSAAIPEPARLPATNTLGG